MRRIVLPRGTKWLTALLPAGRRYRRAMRRVSRLLESCVAERVTLRALEPR